MSDRRTAIADAAIRTLAREGSRGLTHRAVDRAAGLPLGSTSYYLRTRADLLLAAVDRLAELDAAALAPSGGTLASDLAEAMHHLLTADRDRLVARYELALESVRRPELREVLAAGTRRVRDAVTERLGQRGDVADGGVADAVLALVDGLFLAELTATAGRRRGPAGFEEALTRLIEAG